MKKVILLVLLALLAATLVAAIPVQSMDTQEAQQNLGLCWDPLRGKWVACKGQGTQYQYKLKYPGQGEPRMEKVTSFQYVGTSKYAWGDSKCEGSMVITTTGSSWYYCIRTYQLPVGCNFRYQY